MIHMERTPQWILSLSLWIAFIQLFLPLGITMLDARTSKLTTTIDTNPGFISIDCGVDKDYLDEDTNIWYETDTNFVKTGTNSEVHPQVNLDDDFGGLLNTLRSFPQGNRNCYTLKPKQGKNINYLIRAYFSYGNYDGKNQSPIFNLYVGVNFWDRISFEDNSGYFVTEIIHTPTTDTIHVCLVKGIRGIPFISALELRPLNNSVYQTSSPSQSLLFLKERADVGSTSSGSTPHSRYKDDIYDRLWFKDDDVKDWKLFNKSEDIDPANSTDSYKLPAQVEKSAATTMNLSNPLYYDYNSNWSNLEKPSKYYVYFHFVEIEQLGPGKKRIMNISVNDKDILSQPLVLEYLKPITIIHQNVTRGNVRFNISATPESDAPPILNSFEIYKLISPLSSPTDQKDVDAILNIKSTYMSKLDWQGDPCLPNPAWEELERKQIERGHTYFILTPYRIRILVNLSNNHLSGSIPEFLADLPKLKVLNLSSNKLTGSIPQALKRKSDTTLQLSLDDNPGLCRKDACHMQNFTLPLVASVSAFIVLILLVSLGIWIFKVKKLKVVFVNSTKEQSSELKNRAFSYAQVLKITDNLQNLIGEGGFGKVYFGTLKNNNSLVAVKLLSQSSSQGLREFRSELELLMVVHHRHLVSLIGYCEEGGVRALIYEFMANGDLRQHLSGLEYLHNGCKSPIVHRDLKTSNILLNENMQAKIADFGLSRAFVNDNDTHISTRPAGTIGYLDPEFQTSGNLTKRSDVYSFGIIVLELITGQSAIRREGDTFNHILHWVTPKLESGDIHSIVDPRLGGNYSLNSAWKFVDIAMSCTAQSAIQRPDISQIVVELKDCLALEKTEGRTMGNTSSFQFDSDSILSPR
ncbi:putative LRR receptor-like serine/threonine-protein kinase [Senna tora]|uniref:Putative LRR receptor-like serine/threonine-protein kinase n=1 Tax=Senna tora TaxID=362788 RepID=A0A834WAC0_9FABA|nr:putative LRR receptor-like serine/threonine-protein kinase [Senna tora]